ncbi:MAG: hypothetical protein WCD18_21025 [Thermosynechococcaceae cyanobacterium]
MITGLTPTTINHLSRAGEKMQEILIGEGQYFPIELINTALDLWFEQHIEEIAEDAASIIESDRLNRRAFSKFLQAELLEVQAEIVQMQKDQQAMALKRAA